MTVPFSALDKRRTAALEHAAQVVRAAWQAQGVDELRALEYCEEHLTLDVAPGLKVYARLGETRSPGWTDDALTHFARCIHLEHAEQLGGRPVPFGDAPPFIPDAEREHAEQLAADRASASAAAQAAEAQHTANRQHATEAAQRIRDTADRVRDSF